MKTLLTYILLTALVSFSHLANATNYYFSSTTGDDSRSVAQAQNPNTPWKTLSKFNSFVNGLQPGDSILFKRGDIFYGSITITNRSGNSNNPVNFGAYGSGENPIISGFTPISSWVNDGGGIYESTVPSGLSSLNMVTFNNAFQPIGRWPKLTDNNSGYLTLQSHSGSSSITSNAISNVSNYVGGELVIRKNHWIIDRATITGQTSTSITYSGGSDYTPTDGYGFFFQNHVNACTSLGDWCYDGTSKKIKMFFGSNDPSSYSVQAVIVDNLVNITSESYATFTNISFSGSNSKTLNILYSDHILFNLCNFLYAGTNCVFTNGSSSYISITNCTISNTNNNAIEANLAPNWTIQNDSIINTGMIAGMGLSGDGNYMTISNINDGSLVQYNTINNSGYLAINYIGSNMSIQNNLINNFCVVKDDGSAIYTGSFTYTYTNRNVTKNIIIKGGNNGVVDNGTDGAGSSFGIYVDQGQRNVVVDGNTITDCYGAGIHLNSASNVQILNNTFYNNARGFDYTTYQESGVPIANITQTGNIFFAKQANQLTGIALINSGGNAVSTWGTWDNNYYCRPINEPNNINVNGTYGVGATAGIIQIFISGVSIKDVSLDAWKTAANNDLHSKKSPKTITNVNDIRFEYNATTSPKTINLGATYIGVDSTIYSGSITLAPYTSKVLIYLSGVISNQPPVANAGPDQNFFLPTNSVTLNGSGTDADGSIASYQWTKISGPTQFTIGTATQAQTLISNLTQGVYQFELKVTDNLGAIGKDTVTVTVNALPNQLPVANAGQDITITLPVNTTTLSGSGTDADGTIASYRWTKISGPTQYSITSATQAQTGITNLTQGVYQFELKVTDNNGATARDTVSVTVNAAPNQLPVVNAGTDQTITLPTTSVTLNGSAYDPDGVITSYQWTKISGPLQFSILSPLQAQTIINTLLFGVYQFELKVTDNSGAVVRDTINVTVNALPNQLPTANAGQDIIITLPTNTTTLAGNGTDPDGTIASYQWTKISGPLQFSILSPLQAQTAITNLAQGVYQFELKVTDNNGGVGKDTITVTVNAKPNTPPAANAGADMTITLPTNTVTLTGSGSDADGTIASYQWRKISGPTQYTISNSTQAQTGVTNLVQGVYQFELKVTDDGGATARDTVNVIVNVAPVANAGTDQTITLPTNSVTLIGSGTDADGTIASYSWTKISGPTQYSISASTQPQTDITNLVQGVYKFELSVTDNFGAVGTDTVAITVNNIVTNSAPIADAGSDATITLPTNTVTLTGSGTDADGTIASYSWTKISGPSQYTIVSGSQAQTVVNNLIQGVYQFQLMVTDNLGAAGKDTVTITVNSPAANLAPVANAGADINIFLPTNSVTLSGSGTDSDGTVTSYRWTKISGPTQYTISSFTQAQTTVTRLVQGTYKFSLRVTDNDGATGRDTVVVIVSAAPNQLPTANAGSDKLITLPTNSVTLTGNGTDPDGNIASYQWTKISGPSQFTIVSATQRQTAINNLVAGTYQFELKVTDNFGATDADTAIVTVNTPPAVNAGADQTITLPANTITLNGSGADADGTIVSYQWTKISGPAQYSITDATQPQTTVSNLTQGTYQFELTATDDLGGIGKDTMSVTVNAAPNQLPSVNAGFDISITLPTNSVTLTGSGYDPDGFIASYQWTKISGPSQYSITAATQSQTTVTSLVQGVYQFELKVTDNRGASVSDTVVVTVSPVPNQPPTANAGSDKVITLPTNTVTLTGSGTDVDGTIASYSWTKISGPTQYSISSSTQAQTAISNLIQGTYQFELKVTDNSGAIGRDTVNVIVNQPPVANAGFDLNITLPTNTVTLNGSGTDVDGTIASYQWTKIYGPTQYTITSSTQAQISVTNLVQGVYQFELKVTDNFGGTAKDTVVVTVNAAPNQPPVANAGIDISVTLPTNNVTLSGSGTDVDGTIASYQWTKVSGPVQFIISSSSQAQTSVTNLVQGVYQFELKVTDNRGATAKDTVVVTVNPRPNQAPIVNAGIDQSVTLPANTVALTGSATDPDGTIASYQWTKISGPTQYSISAATQSQTTVTNLLQGVYQFELKATDNLGAVGKDTILILVYGAPVIPNQAPIANAGADKTITLPTNNVTLIGGGADQDGTIASYQWTKISGPTQFFISTYNQSTTNITSLGEGTYQFELQVTDNQGAIGKDTVNVTVLPEGAVVSATVIKAFPNPATTSITVEINLGSNASKTNIDIYNSAGVMVAHFEEVMTSQLKLTKQIDISSLASGVYFIQVGIDATNKKVIQFVKQ